MLSKVKSKLPEIFNLDIGCGLNPQPDFIGMDKRDLDHVTIQHNIEDFPWPIPDSCVKIALASHVLEHLDPRTNLEFFEECHRVLMPGGMLCIAVPYAGSVGAYQDPTHTRPGFNENTWSYFDPRMPLWGVYRPSPFLIESCDFVHLTNMEVKMRCIKPEYASKMDAETLRHFKNLGIKGFELSWKDKD